MEPDIEWGEGFDEPTEKPSRCRICDCDIDESDDDGSDLCIRCWATVNAFERGSDDDHK